MSGSDKQFELRDAIAPYVCSTPLDFTEERNYLSRTIFPQLNQLCKSRGSFFNPSDLRWIPGDQKAEKGFLLTTLLSSIKKCSPFFICLLGETYGPFRQQGRSSLTQQLSSSAAAHKSGGNSNVSGSTSGSRRGKPAGSRRESRGISSLGSDGTGQLENDGVGETSEGQSEWLDKNFVMAGTGGHPWVLQEGHENSSITELEVTQGVLLCDSQHATLYYRQSDHLDEKLARAPDDKARERLIQRFSSESEEARLRVHDLRQRMINRGVPVRFFRTPQELGQLVLEDWLEVIDTVLPPLLHSVKLLDTLEFKEWQAQQSFIRNRSQVFVSSPGVQDTLQKLTDFAFECERAEVKGDLLDEIFSTPSNNKKVRSYSATTPYKKKPVDLTQSNSILLLIGDRGVGKSSLAAKWLTDFQSEHSSNAAGIPVISHFVSASNNSADLIGFIRHCIFQLREIYLLSEPNNPLSIRAAIEAESEAKDPSFRSLCEAFVAALGLGPCVILLDGVNELTSARGLSAREVKEFGWLQDSLPSTCKLILTTTRSDISYRCLVSRKDVTVTNCPESITDPQVTLAMVKEHHPLLSQLVGGEKRLGRLSQLKIMSTALGARVVASEVSCHRIYSKLPAFLEDCAEVWSLRDFWVMSLKNWILEHNWTLDTPASEILFMDNGFDFSGWVTDSLCLIAVSRNGLTACQILSILEVMGYEGDLQVTSYDWMQFRTAAGATLREMEDGRLIFGHRYLQEIAEYLFFKSMTSVSYNPATILKLACSGPRHSYHAQLARFFSREPLDTQVMEELPWQLMWSGQVAQLMDFLTDCGVLLKMLSSESTLWQQDLKLYWSMCQLSGHSPSTVYLQLAHALGVVNSEDAEIPEVDTYSRNSPTDSYYDVNPRIVVSTPQPSYPDVDHDSVDDARRGNENNHFEVEDDEVGYLEEDGTGFEDIEIEYGHHITGGSQQEKKPLDNIGEKARIDSEEGQRDEEENRPKSSMFLTQEAMDDDLIVSSGTVDNLGTQEEKEDNNFSGTAYLCWQVARLLWAMGEKKTAYILLSSLIKYIKKNYPLTLDQQLLLCRCYYTAGSLAEAYKDLNSAELDYRQALHALVAAEDVDDELEFEEDTRYLKGLLLSCHGSLRVQGDELFEAEELLKEALECVDGNPNCFVLKSTIFANLGQLRYAQGDFPRAESCLREAAKLRSRWFGRCHSLVADVLVSLAKLLATPGNTKGQDAGQAEQLFRQALTISEKCFGATSLPVSGVLFHLGELLAEEQSHPAKMEAQKLLRRCMDIRTSELGGNHPMSQATQLNLTRLDVALKLGHYEFGSARHTERRPNNLPFSNLTFREDDLNRLNSRLSMIRADSGQGREQPISIRAVSREEVMRHNQPESMLSLGGPGGVSFSSLFSASERLLTAPVGDRPERLLSRREKEEKPELREPQRPLTSGQVKYLRTSSLPENRGAGSDLVIVESLDSKGRRHVVGEKGRKSMSPMQNQSNNQLYSTDNNGQPLEGIPTHVSDKNVPSANKVDDHQELNDESGKKAGYGRQTLTVNLKEDGYEEGREGEAESPRNLENDVDESSSNAPDTAVRKSVVIRPASGSRRMFQKYSCGNESAGGGKVDLNSSSNDNMSRDQMNTPAKPSGRATSSIKTTSARSRRAWSGRSAASSATSGHVSRCHVPGPHDLSTSAHTVVGPNSSLSSLLGEPPRPRPASRPIYHHHRSAWYHVPGRYATPDERFPRKRMQKTENARDIEAFVALKSQWAKRRQGEIQQARLRELQLQEDATSQDHASIQHTALDTALSHNAAHPKKQTTKKVVSSSKGRNGSKPSSKNASGFTDFKNQQMASTRRLVQPDATPRLMISGLDMVPESRYPDTGHVYYTSSQSHGVKFREPIVVG